MGCKRAILVSSVAIMMVVIIGLAPANALEGGDWVGTWHKIKLKLKNVCEFDGLDPLYKIKSGGPAWIYIRNWDGVDTYGATLMLASMDDQWIPSGFTLTRIDGTAADGLLQSSNIAFIDDNIGEEIELSFVVRLKGKAKEGELKSGKILNVVGLAKLKYPFAECFASMTCSGKLVKENKVPPDIYAAKNSSKIFTIAGEVAQCSFHDSTPRTGIASDGTKFLVVTRRWDDSLKGLIGVLLSSGGQVIKEFVIAPWGARPAVAFDGTNYLVVYTVDFGINCIRISADGTVIDPDGGFQISSSYDGSGVLGVEFDGTNFLAVYSKFTDYTTYADVYGTFITPDAQISSPFLISRAVKNQHLGDLAFDGMNYFAVWVDYRNEDGGGGGMKSADLYGARISTAGDVLDPDGIPIATAETFQDRPQIAFDGSNFLLIWFDHEIFTTTKANIYGKRISPEGTLMDGPPESNGIVVNTRDDYKDYPTLAFDGQNFLATWTVRGWPSSNTPVGIYAARVSPSGNLIDTSANSLGIPIAGSPASDAELENASSMFNGRDLLLTWIVVGGCQVYESQRVDGRFFYSF